MWRRLRTSTKWMCAAVGVASLVALAASEWSFVLWISADHRTRTVLEEGDVCWARYRSGQGEWQEPFTGLVCGLTPPGRKLKIWIRPRWNFALASTQFLIVALWIP